ncbi:RNA-directed DNA polymerase, eukaryota, reverse transcriptase zinc-binding domain protein [Tanacetum coccineum]
MDREIRFMDDIDSADNDNVDRAVFVSDSATFIVTDDLCVMPHTLGRCIQLLIDLGVTDPSHLEERTIEIGRGQSTGKLLFAEAEEDFVDFVFGFLAISLGTVIGSLMNVAEDLLISSSFSISTMDILNKWKVPLNDIEMHKASIGLEEGLKMSKTSLRSKSTLTKGLEKHLKNLNQNY